MSVKEPKAIDTNQNEVKKYPNVIVSNQGGINTKYFLRFFYSAISTLY